MTPWTQFWVGRPDPGSPGPVKTDKRFFGAFGLKSHVGCLWTPLDPTRPLVPVPRYFSVLFGTFWYFNLILKG